MGHVRPLADHGRSGRRPNRLFSHAATTASAKISKTSKGQQRFTPKRPRTDSGCHEDYLISYEMVRHLMDPSLLSGPGPNYMTSIVSHS
jgi:hypothetical protein